MPIFKVKSSAPKQCIYLVIIFYREMHQISSAAIQISQIFPGRNPGTLITGAEKGRGGDGKD